MILGGVAIKLSAILNFFVSDDAFQINKLPQKWDFTSSGFILISKYFANAPYLPSPWIHPPFHYQIWMSSKKNAKPFLLIVCRVWPQPWIMLNFCRNKENSFLLDNIDFFLSLKGLYNSNFGPIRLLGEIWVHPLLCVCVHLLLTYYVQSDEKCLVKMKRNGVEIIWVLHDTCKRIEKPPLSDFGTVPGPFLSVHQKNRTLVFLISRLPYDFRQSLFIQHWKYL